MDIDVNRFDAQGLFDYALEREDIKWLLNGLPHDVGIDPDTVEYELHLLKIVSVGWALSYYLPDGEARAGLLESFWQAIRDVADNLSRTTNMLTGQEVDYFQALITPGCLSEC